MRPLPSMILFAGTVLRGLALAVFVFAALAGGAVAADDRAAVERQIRDLEKAWTAAIAVRDAKFIANLYAPDAYFMPHGSPRIDGREAIGKAWEDFLQTPGFTLNTQTVRVEVASAADLVAEIGTYAMRFESGNGRIEENGKYLVLWKKHGTEWKVAADIFNPDTPP